jgi:hypothetical protein
MRMLGTAQARDAEVEPVSGIFLNARMPTLTDRQASELEATMR